MAADAETPEPQEPTTPVETETPEAAEPEAPETPQEPDWKSESRKHERRSKEERRAKEAAEKRLKEIEDRDKSDTEKAIEKAREEARTEALSAADKERRADRLEVAVARLGAKSFADVDDALLHIRQRIDRNDIDPGELFDTDGRVDQAILKTALDELLAEKPHLKAGTVGVGESDAGRGEPGAADLDAWSVEDHLNKQRRHKT